MAKKGKSDEESGTEHDEMSESETDADEMPESGTEPEEMPEETDRVQTENIEYENAAAMDSDDPLEIPGSSESRSSLWKYKCRLRGVLTADPVDIMNILSAFNNVFEVDAGLSNEISKLQHPGNMTTWQYKYRAKKVSDIFTKVKSCDVRVKLMMFWLDQLLSHSVIEAIFDSVGILLPPIFVPKSVSRVATELTSKYLSCSSKSTIEIRQNSTKFMIELAKKCNLSLNNRDGDSYILSGVTSCNPKFARKALEAIDSNTEKKLLQLRRTRIDAIKCPPSVS